MWKREAWWILKVFTPFPQKKKQHFLIDGASSEGLCELWKNKFYRFSTMFDFELYKSQLWSTLSDYVCDITIKTRDELLIMNIC